MGASVPGFAEPLGIGQCPSGAPIYENAVNQSAGDTYNVFVTQAEKEIFDLASKTGVGLLCRMPLAQGILTGKFPIGQKVPEGHRAGRAGKNLERRIEMTEDLRHIAAAYPGGLTRLALHFSLAPQAVSCIIPGARNKAQLEENIGAANGSMVSPEVREQIEQIRRKWDRDHINFMLVARKWFRRLIPNSLKLRNPATQHR